MGIYDREYYRREGPSFLETISRWGVVCKWLIILNACAYVIQLLTDQRGGGPFASALDLNVEDVLHGQLWRRITYGFLHDTGSVWHILFNMLFLWWFGTEVEDVYGPKEFLTFYLVGVLAGGLGFVGEAVVRGELFRSALGASAGVTAVMVLCACHFPRRVIYLFMMLPVPIWVFVIFQVAQDLFGLLGARGGGRTAFSAHLGGALFAFAYYKWEGRLLALVPDFRAWFQRRRQPQPPLKLYREEEEVPQPVPAGGGAAEVDEQLEAKLDAVLEKVQRFGQNSLTEGEREILMKASEVFRRRRS